MLGDFFFLFFIGWKDEGEGEGKGREFDSVSFLFGLSV